MKRRNYLKAITAFGGMATLSQSANAQSEGKNSSQNSDTSYKAIVGPKLKIIDYGIGNVEEVEVDGSTSTETKKVAEFNVDVECSKEGLNVTLTDAFSAFATKGINQVQTSEIKVAKGRNTISERTTAIQEMAGLGISTPNSAGIGISTGLPTEGFSEQEVGLGESVAVGGGVGLAGVGIAAHRKMKGTDSKPLSLDERLEDKGGIW